MIDFFYNHGGWSYDPSKESSEEGHYKSAESLAQAFKEVMEADAYVGWEVDDIDSTEFDSASPPRQLLGSTLFINGKSVASLSGIDISNTGDPYAKVIEAELWQDHKPEQDE